VDLDSGQEPSPIENDLGRLQAYRLVHRILGKVDGGIHGHQSRGDQTLPRVLERDLA